jgi:SAM-dependent methyltransferase
VRADHMSQHASSNTELLPRLSQRACPVCGEFKSRLLHTQIFEQVSGVQLLDGYDVVVCLNCGTGFADHIPPQATFDAYYRDLSKYEYEYRGGQATQYEDRRFRESAKSIVPHIPGRDARILEIGCATGHLLSLLKEEGYPNVYGVDPSPGCAKAAQDLYGVPVQSCTIFNIPPQKDLFDLVALLGVMEHIRDLDPAIEAIRALLGPVGRIYLAVPDAAHFDRNKDAPFQEFSLEHLNFFSEASLRNLMQARGFKFLSAGSLLLEHSPGTWCASIYCVFENTDKRTGPWVRDDETEKGLAAYIRKSQQAEERIRQTIEDLAASGRPILVWGTGAHTQRLLAMSALGKVNIAAFVDSNPKYQGRQLHGKPILSPESLRSRREPILICSYAAQKEIALQIRERLRLENELIELYDVQA